MSTATRDARGAALLFRWRKALLSEQGPKPTRRFVLLVLSTFANDDGTNAYPSTRTLADATGLSRRAVEGHLRRAVIEGWVVRIERGSGQGWRRMGYTLTLPHVGNVVPHLQAQRGEPRSAPSPANVGNLTHDVGNVVPRRGEPRSPDFSRDLPKDLPEKKSDADRASRSRRDAKALFFDHVGPLLDSPEKLADAIPGLYGLGIVGAAWIGDGLRVASADPLTEEWPDYPDRVVAGVLWDLERQAPSNFTRRRFLGFLLRELGRPYPHDDSEPPEDIAELVAECWPLQGRTARRRDPVAVLGAVR